MNNKLNIKKNNNTQINEKNIYDVFVRQNLYYINEYNNLANEYDSILNSTMWKILNPLRKILDTYKKIKNGDNIAIDTNDDNTAYNKWINYQENNFKRKTFKRNPIISILIPVYDVPYSILCDCIESVEKQSYNNWEIIIVNDGSNSVDVINALSKFKKERKIKIINKKINEGISKATNTAIAKSSGDYIALLDCDDLLSPNALQEIVEVINNNDLVNIIYSDEDKISEDGKIKYNPFFKPNYSPDTLLWTNYISHFTVYNRKVINNVGTFNCLLDGSQDYDYLLRAVEIVQTNTIFHIPKVLYHWRSRKESTANNINSKPYAIEAAKKARKNAIKRRNINAEIVSKKHDDVATDYIYYKNDCDGISIIVNCKDDMKELKLFVDEISNDFASKITDISLIISNNDYAKRKKHENFIGVDYIYDKNDENFSFNKVIEKCAGELILFVDDSINFVEKEHLSILIGQAKQKHTGAVGIKTKYSNTNIIDNCGIACTCAGPIKLLNGLEDSVDHYFSRNRANYNVLAVCTSCMLVEKKKIISVGGFEKYRNIYLCEIDLCIKLYMHGFFNIIRNDFAIYNTATYKRNISEFSFEEVVKMLKNNSSVKYNDPFYNINFFQFNGRFIYNNML